MGRPFRRQSSRNRGRALARDADRPARPGPTRSRGSGNLGRPHPHRRRHARVSRRRPRRRRSPNRRRDRPLLERGRSPPRRVRDEPGTRRPGPARSAPGFVSVALRRVRHRGSGYRSRCGLLRRRRSRWSPRPEWIHGGNDGRRCRRPVQYRGGTGPVGDPDHTPLRVAFARAGRRTQPARNGRRNRNRRRRLPRVSGLRPVVHRRSVANQA